MNAAPLDRLAAAAGIELEYRDVWGRPHALSPETKLAFLRAMKIPATSEAEIAAGIETFAASGWRRALEPVIVLRSSHAPATIAIATDASGGGVVGWQVTTEDGERREGTASVSDLPVADATVLEGRRLERRLLAIPTALPLGYHRLETSGKALIGGSCAALLIVAPGHAYLPEPLRHGPGLWGFALQLYGLQGRESWGIGDFGDLAGFASATAALGAGILGLNPLHALFPGNPAHASPYSPSSRRFLNPLYISVERMPEFRDAATDPGNEAAGSTHSPASLRQTPLVDHVQVAAAKYAAFERLYRIFARDHLNRATARAGEFRQFQREGGVALERQATFEALAEFFRGERVGHVSWRQWPAFYCDPSSPEVAAFALEHQDRVMFHQYLQWEAERQLGVAAATAIGGGMSIGLYRDLALGIDPDGAEAWSERELLAHEISAGAPPDALGPQGQNWGSPPFNPHALPEVGYRPFIDCIRANMRHSGALRIDHVMGLTRLFWIPRGASPAEGGYVRYPLEELLAIAALESERARCVIIGEDLGTVPDGFRERLAAENILSTRVLYFERDDAGFRPPRNYPALAHAAIGTHDLPTFAGYWRDRDIALRGALGLLPPAIGEAELRQERAEARSALLAALREAGLLEDAQGIPMSELVEAVHRFLATSPARLLVLQLEDIFEVENPTNLPGTVDQYPNWRRKLPIEWERLVADPRLRRLAEIMNGLRCAEVRR